MGMYVDENLLSKGIYVTHKPYLKEKDTTIESMVEIAKMSKDMLGNPFVSDSYFENLQSCKLIDVTLSF